MKEIEEYDYVWLDEEKSYCIFDAYDNPIMETLDFLKTITNKSTQENYAVALKHWFEFLGNAYKVATAPDVCKVHPYKTEIHFMHAETKHITHFQMWLKTPPEDKGAWDRTIMKDANTIATSRNVYVDRISLFYKRYVKPRNSACTINFTHENHYNPKEYDPKHQKELLSHKEKEITTSPDTLAVPIEAFKAIRAKATENYGSRNREATNIRNGILLDLAYTIGLRRGEITNIEITQFANLDRSTPTFLMTIHNSYHERPDNQTKTGGRQVFIPMGQAIRIARYIKQHRIKPEGKDHGILFTQVEGKNRGQPFNGDGISSMFKRAAKKAGYGQYSIHGLRHGATTNARSLGMNQKPLMDMLGHKSPDTTNRYHQYSAARQKEIVDHLEAVDKLIKDEGDEA